jgi:hypothetical protein
MPLTNRRWRRVLTGWLIAFTILVFWALHEQRELSDANRSLIADIQQARVSSCRQTYEGVREVFLPFFPPKKDRTAEQQANLDKLDRTVDRLKARCGQQTRVTKGATE